MLELTLHVPIDQLTQDTEIPQTHPLLNYTYYEKHTIETKISFTVLTMPKKIKRKMHSHVECE